MKFSKRMISFLFTTVLLAGMLCACAKHTDAAGSGAPTETSAVLTEITEAPDISNATAIIFSNGTAAVSGNGAKEENGVVTITDGGTYTVTGEQPDGRIVVNAPDREVTLVLENTSICCSYGSPIYVYKSSLTTLYLAEGTNNSLTDGSDYTFSDGFSSAEGEEPNACLYSKSDLVIAGGGQLTVNANYNNGITGKDTLKIETASLAVTAKNHGINGKDSCVIQNAAVQVTSGGDALRSTNDTGVTLGYIVIADSSLNLTAGEDGIQAETTLAISGGSCSVTSGGGSSGSISGSGAKGLKAGSDLSLSGGVYTLNCCDDAVHANGSVLIIDGTYTIETGDDGIHADENAKVTGGTVTVSKSYEGIEGATVDILGGTIQITASDDGINAGGGTDQSGFGPRQDRFGGSSDCSIHISGGVITIDASGDGVDSNGNLTVSGGELYISGSADGGNGALDYDGTASVSGGIVVAAGSSGMAQNFGGGSTQGSILLSYPSYSAETICLKDSSGTILASYSPAKGYNCVVISCPSITTGSTYTVEAWGQTSTVTMSSLIYGNANGMGGNPFGGGNGGMQPGCPGGMGGPGGMGNPGGRP